MKRSLHFYLIGFGLAISPFYPQSIVLGQPFQPEPIEPDTGTPRDRKGGIRRDDCPVVYLSPTVLVPDVSNLSSYTTYSRPTLWVYLPYTLNESASEAENPLEQIGNSARIEIDDENREEIEDYETFISGQLAEPGIISLTLPETVPDLEIGEEYRWTLLLYCGDRHHIGRPLTVSGWITRIEPGSVPAENIWYDRLTEVGTALRNDPTNRDLADQWAELMQFVEVDGIAEQPLQNCCTLERSQYP